jgi:hypothetical protein
MNSCKIIISICLIIAIQACEKLKNTGSFVIEGKVINVASNEPIDSVQVILYGGNPLSNPMMPDFNDNPPNGNNDTTYSDENGEFWLQIHGESAAYIGWRKEGYRNGKVVGGNKFFKPIHKEIIIEYESECNFAPVFKKLGDNQDNDTLIVYISTNSYPISHFPYKEFYGQSPFKLNNDLGFCNGSAYFHYKLRYTKSNIWNELIDSIYIEDFETYTDTIYYGH